MDEWRNYCGMKKDNWSNVVTVAFCVLPQSVRKASAAVGAWLQKVVIAASSMLALQLGLGQAEPTPACWRIGPHRSSPDLLRVLILPHCHRLGL